MCGLAHIGTFYFFSRNKNFILKGAKTRCFLIASEFAILPDNEIFGVISKNTKTIIDILLQIIYKCFIFISFQQIFDFLIELN